MGNEGRGVRENGSLQEHPIHATRLLPQSCLCTFRDRVRSEPEPEPRPLPAPPVRRGASRALVHLAGKDARTAPAREYLSKWLVHDSDRILLCLLVSALSTGVLPCPSFTVPIRPHDLVVLTCSELPDDWPLYRIECCFGNACARVDAPSLTAYSARHSAASPWRVFADDPHFAVILRRYLHVPLPVLNGQVGNLSCKPAVPITSCNLPAY